MYPVDMLKVMIYSGAPTLVCAQPSQTRLQVLKPAEGGIYTGMQQAFWRIGKVEGYGSMWKGVTSVIMGAGICCTSALGVETNDAI